MHRSLKLAAVLTLASVGLLPGVAGGQERPQCPPPTISSTWADNDDVYTVRLSNHLSVYGLICQYDSVGVVMRSLPEQIVLARTVTPLYGILPGGVGLGPPAEVTLTRPSYPCGTHNVQIDVVPADVAAGIAVGQPAVGGLSSWAQKTQTLEDGVCFTPSTTQPALRATTLTAETAPAATISTTTSVALPTILAAAGAGVGWSAAAPVQTPAPTAAPVSTSADVATTSPPATEATAESTTTTAIAAASVLSALPVSATRTAPVSTPGPLPAPESSDSGLLVGLGAVLVGVAALLIGWRRRAA